LKFIELFSGIGGMGYGLIKSGFECVGFCEKDKFAHESFNLLHNQNKTMWEGYDINDVTDDDIRNIERERGKVSLISAGFPCQSFSIVGQRRGFSDTRGTLIYEVFRFTSILRPEYLLLENVKGLLNHDKGRTFRIILECLDELGYDAEWQVLNSKNFGVPQNRERIFIVGHLRGTRRKQIFPITRKSEMDIKIEGRIDLKGFDILKRVYSVEGISPTLNTNGGGNRETKIKILNNVRKLTPLECFRIQSFPDQWIYVLKKNKYSDNQLYKLAGNAVTSNVSYEIGKKIKE
jgi:DNA (cytosine-5)-methyltransferase 1